MSSLHSNTNPQSGPRIHSALSAAAATSPVIESAPCHAMQLSHSAMQCSSRVAPAGGHTTPANTPTQHAGTLQQRQQHQHVQMEHTQQQAVGSSAGSTGISDETQYPAAGGSRVKQRLLVLLSGGHLHLLQLHHRLELGLALLLGGSLQAVGQCGRGTAVGMAPARVAEPTCAPAAAGEADCVGSCSAANYTRCCVDAASPAALLPHPPRPRRRRPPLPRRSPPWPPRP